MNEQPLRALLVGAGNMGQAWAKNLAANADVRTVGWADLRDGAAADAAAKLGLDVGACGTDYPAMLRDLRPDFVVDVTVPEAHHDVTLAALGAGAAVLGEKPMADTIERARAMVAASERAGKLYMVSQSRRYDARIAAYRTLVRENLGPLGILDADFSIGAHFGGFRDAMDSPLLLDMAIHTFDAARYVSGADSVSVYCEEFNPAWSWYRGNACAVALFEMTGGLRFTYRGSWCSDGRHTSWEAEWRAVGPDGSATWDGKSDLRADVVAAREGFHYPTVAKTAEPQKDVPAGIAGSLREFVAALRTGSTPMGECHDNIKSLAMVFAAVRSAREGRRVSIER